MEEICHLRIEVNGVKLSQENFFIFPLMHKQDFAPIHRQKLPCFWALGLFAFRLVHN